MKRCFLGGIFIVLALFLGCKKQEKSETSTLHLYLQAEPLSLDPRIGGDRRSQVVLRCLFEGLTHLAKDGSIEPGLAEATNISPDGCTYTFHLRDAVWSNGQKIRAQDFCYAWKSAISPHFPSSFAYHFFIIKNAKKAKLNECALDEVGILALDDQTLQVTLEHPAPYFLELVSNPLYSPLPELNVETNSLWAMKTIPEYISNGPFILKEHVLQSHMTLERNPLYWSKDRSSIEQISLPIIEHPSTAYALFEKGELDWFGDPCGLCDLEVIQKLTKDGTLLFKESGALYRIVCNTLMPHLASAKIRCAIASAISRKDLCYLLIKGGEQPSSSIVPSFLSSLKRPVFHDGDGEFARACFEEGLKELGYTRETYPPIILTHWAEPLSKLIAQCIQQQIETALHTQVSLVAYDWGTYMHKVPAGEINIATASWLTWVSDPMPNLQYLKFKNNGINGSGWQDDRYIDLLDKADNSLSQEERKKYLMKAEEIAAEELPIIPLYELVYKYAKGPGVRGEVISSTGMVDFKWVEKKSTSSN